jgi:hypothetical protein
VETYGQGDRASGAAPTAADGRGRFRVTEAPGDLRIVQELLNTAAIRKTGEDIPDLLDAPDSAARWLGAYGIPGDSPGVGALRSLRDAVRLSLIDRDRDPSQGEDTAPPRVETTALLRLDPDGAVRLVPDSVGTRAFGQRVLLAIHDAQLTGTWRRLKLCRNPQCLVAFWDNSRNTSGVWHDVRTCGNAANLRRSRARRARDGAAASNQPNDNP